MARPKAGAVREPPLRLGLGAKGRGGSRTALTAKAPVGLSGRGFSQHTLFTLIFSRVYSDHQAADTAIRQNSQESILSQRL